MVSTKDSKLFQKIQALRQELHQHPELSGQEDETAKRICRELDELGISYRSDVAGHGIVAEIPGQVKKPFIALRGDMDALPITEETGLSFSSKNEGVMHACAHDGHMAILIGAAKLLLAEDPLPLPIRLIFQPAEEIAQGAKDMVEAGVMEDVAMIFGGHIDRHFLPGTIAVTNGPVNASSDAFRIHIHGRGGHSARPHETLDAVVIGSLMVMAIQTIVSREVNPAFPSVVSVGKFSAGTKGNVIAGSAVLDGTIRAQHEHVRQQLIDSIKRIAKSVCDLHGAAVEVEIREGTPSLSNSPEMADLARQAAKSVIGKEKITKLDLANMGGEDFSYFLEKVPGCYVRYGGQVQGRESFPAHSSQFDFDEEALAVGAHYLAAVAKLAAQKVQQSS